MEHRLPVHRQALNVVRHFRQTPLAIQSNNLKAQLNIFHFALTGIIVIACGLIFISYSWISFATFTERPGLKGDWYYYYRTNRLVFGFYKLLMAIGALLTIVRLSYVAYKGDRPKVIKAFILFAIFLAVVILCEVYLSTRFVGKG